jgi:glyoxylase-like metal-dependent hydrolase (beta-lactamase superfamily II)
MTGPTRFHLGNLDMAVLSDGYFLADAGALFGIVPKVLWQPVVGDALDDLNRVHMDLNSLLFRSQGKTILVETGVGGKPGQRRYASPEEDGTLFTSLAEAGVRPEEVDVVINSHLHFDHCGWNTVMDGEKPVPLFPRARYYVQRSEYDAFMHPNERTRATYFEENLAPVMESGQLELVEGELPITDEVRFVPTPGHSDGHASLFVHSAGETLIYTGDMAQHIAHLERIPWQSAWDIMQIVAMETKKRVTEQAIKDGSLILLTHGPYPGLGRLVLTPENRRKWVPVS